MVVFVCGEVGRLEGMFSYLRLEERVPADFRCGRSGTLVDAALAELSPAFEALHAQVGRPSVSGAVCCAPCYCRPLHGSGRSGC